MLWRFCLFSSFTGFLLLWHHSSCLWRVSCMRNTSLLNPEHLVLLLDGPISHGSLQWWTFILDLSLIDLLLIFFSIWICHFDPVASLGIESTIKLLSSYEMFSSCFLVSFWVQDHSLPLCHYRFQTIYKLCIKFFGSVRKKSKGRKIDSKLQ